MKAFFNAVINIFDPYRKGPLFTKYGWKGFLAIAVFTAAFYLSFAEKTNTVFGSIFHLFTIGVHEAGHPIFNILFFGNHFMMIIGGTAMELIVPIAAFIYFLRKGWNIQADFCLILLGIAFKSIGGYAGYMLDDYIILLNADENTKPDWEYMHQWFGTADYDFYIRYGLYLLAAFVISLAIYLIIRHTYDLACGPKKPYEPKEEFKDFESMRRDFENSNNLHNGNLP